MRSQPRPSIPFERLLVAADRCKGCELCVHACPEGILALDRSHVNWLGYNPVLWIPSYGPEMRGGTANCTVIASDTPIGSPVVDHLDAAVLLNPPSMATFLPMVAGGGLVIVNESLIEAAVDRTDLRVLRVRCMALAREAGAERLTSVVALGALTGGMGLIGVETARAALCAMVERKHPELLDANLRAFESGLDAVALGAFVH